MPEPDFRGLQDELNGLVQQPDFGTVRRRAGRLRARARVAAAAGTLVAAAVAVLAAVTVLPSLAALREPPGPAAGARPEVVWAGAGDRDHLYAVLADCADCVQRLVASTDGGRTWQRRSEFGARPDGDPVRPTVLGPTFLVVDLPLADPGKGSRPTARRISVDGGRIWRDAGAAGSAREAAAPGTRIWGCVLYAPPDCGIVVADPEAGALAPLASPPPLDAAVPLVAPPSAGYWVRGCDPATGRPALAVSRTGGRSWSTHVFDRDSAVDGCFFDAATTDGRTVVVSFLDPDAGALRRVYRSTDGGAGWRSTDSPRLPEGWRAQGASLVARDGSHVILAQRETSSGLLVSPDGRVYTQLSEPVAVVLAPPAPVDQGRYLWYDARHVYLSEDGLRWRPVTPE
ncbi:hypothetical protein NLX85_10765 [Micromonospora sp. A3M-1-15]|uniref:hypothetical protein n=1 Tax=Micromonospora sp. A3M-1-15 TaxID=2962035 RepID=UPI0020B7E7DD|nr:hypothetical protein [Micromonospora sp. A3M-1-15]MCP3783845.1 hypothetical protein [Micromonospora sp. A3M-1-15]